MRASSETLADINLELYTGSKLVIRITLWLLTPFAHLVNYALLGRLLFYSNTAIPPNLATLYLKPQFYVRASSGTSIDIIANFSAGF